MLLGLTGPNAAGKGEVARLLARRGWPVHSLSDVVRDEARARGLGVERIVLIEVGTDLRSRFGPGVLAERILEKVHGDAVIDSIRSPFEVEVLRRRPDFTLVGVDAPIAVRWRRAVERGREGDVPDFDTFVAREQLENRDHPNSQQLVRTLSLADLVVVNDGSLEQLEQAVDGVVRSLTSPRP